MKRTLKKKKITVSVPTKLLNDALYLSNQTITSVVRADLELVVANSACSKLVKMRGKVRVNLDLCEMRRDRY